MGHRRRADHLKNMLINRSRTLAHLREYNLDVLVVSSPANITYFTDYSCWLDPIFKQHMMIPGSPICPDPTAAYAVFPLEGEPALVVNPMFAINAGDLWVRDLHTYGNPGLDTSLTPKVLPDVAQRFFDLVHAGREHRTPTDALVSILKTRGLTDARIGIEPGGLGSAARGAIAKALPDATIRDCSNLVRLIRMVKSDEEIARMARAAEISEEAAMGSLALARPALPIKDVAQHYREQLAGQGAELDHFLFGVQGVGQATDLDYVLADDDVLAVDFGCIYRNYFSDTGTTLAMIEPSSQLLEKHAALRDCVEAGAEAVRPGAKSSDVHAAMQSTLMDHGIVASFPHGHGLGLEVRDYPILVADNGLRIRDDCVDVPSDLPLETDMVINLEAMIFIPGVASPHTEQTIVVTANGSRPLVRQDRAQPIRPGHS